MAIVSMSVFCKDKHCDFFSLSNKEHLWVKSFYLVQEITGSRLLLTALALGALGFSGSEVWGAGGGHKVDQTIKGKNY